MTLGQDHLSILYVLDVLNVCMLRGQIILIKIHFKTIIHGTVCAVSIPALSHFSYTVSNPERLVLLSQL